jgi:hypothetical protein
MYYPKHPTMKHTPFTEGRRAAERGLSEFDNPYKDWERGEQWEEGFYSFEPKQKIKKGKPEWN